MATRTGADNKTSFVDRRPIGLCASFQHSPEIGARAVRFDPRGFGHLAHAEIAVNQTRPMISLRLYAGGRKCVGVGLTFITQRIEPGRANDGRRESCVGVGAQRRNSPVRALRRFAQILP